MNFNGNPGQSNTNLTGNLNNNLNVNLPMRENSFYRPGSSFETFRSGQFQSSVNHLNMTFRRLPPLKQNQVEPQQAGREMSSGLSYYNSSSSQAQQNQLSQLNQLNQLNQGNQSGPGNQFTGWFCKNVTKMAENGWKRLKKG